MSIKPYHIASIEDEKDISDLLKDFFIKCGFHFSSFANANQFFENFKLDVYDLLIVDYNLPGMKGTDIIRQLREQTQALPIIMLTANSANEDIIEGTKAGADTYITKPFDFDILLAKVNRNLRRIEHRPLPSEIKITPASYEVQHLNKRARLTPKEFKIFEVLYKHFDQFIARDQISSSASDNRSLDVHIHSIRRKLEPINLNIETLKNVGYRVSIPT